MNKHIQLIEISHLMPHSGADNPATGEPGQDSVAGTWSFRVSEWQNSFADSSVIKHWSLFLSPSFWAFKMRLFIILQKVFDSIHRKKFCVCVWSVMACTGICWFVLLPDQTLPFYLHQNNLPAPSLKLSQLCFKLAWCVHHASGPLWFASRDQEGSFTPSYHWLVFVLFFLLLLFFSSLDCRGLAITRCWHLSNGLLVLKQHRESYF